jgi:uncharacterized NAD-dependent epimerase/dehydratase family protein
MAAAGRTQTREQAQTWPEGRAIIYCEGAFGTTNGKTAHGLVRRSYRYTIVSVIDSRLAGRDAGEVLDGRSSSIPVLPNIRQAVATAAAAGAPATHLVVGLAPDGGRLSPGARADVATALELGLNVDAGLHDLLAEDPRLAALATEKGVRIRDVRQTPPRDRLHFFSGKIEQVDALRIAVLGTDSAVGKRTTAWLLVDALRAAGRRAELVGTGQTAWLQGARYGIILDVMINDFLTGEIEHAVWSAWHEGGAEVLVLEGQGSLLNPAYPGGYELLAAGRPHLIVLQHAPRRREYDGFPGYPIQPLSIQIQALELISGKPVVAVTVNHEGLSAEEIPAACAAITAETGLPAIDVLRDGADRLLDILRPHLARSRPE